MLISLQNPLVKEIRKLHQGKYRRQQQQVLLEGTHLLQEASAMGWQLLVVCYTPQWQAQQSPEFLARLQERSQRFELVSPEVLKFLSTTVTPDGVIAVAATPSRELPQIPHLGLALERIQDPGNLGTMIRAAAAAGADGLLLSQDCVELENPKLIRSTAGSWFRLPMAVMPNSLEVLNGYQQQGVQLVATLPQATLSYWQLDLQKPTLFLLGNEGAGLSPEWQALANQAVNIPLAGGVESLNVGVAAALLLYEARRQCSI
jgi:RNA methyltransferase, TrmH family